MEHNIITRTIDESPRQEDSEKRADCIKGKPAMNSGTDISDQLMTIYTKLKQHFGCRKWWPADSPFEVCVGAILTQNTSWKNVVLAIDNLKNNSAMDCEAIYRMPIDDLARIIRPAGYFNVKASRLKNFINLLYEKYDGNLDALFKLSAQQPLGAAKPYPEPLQKCRNGHQKSKISPHHIETLRNELLSVNGIGKETADSMILYAAGMPIFVVDVYTRRVLSRHSIIAEKADYDQIQSIFHSGLATDTMLFNDFHAQFVAVGNKYCGKKPKCGECPLKGYIAMN